MAKTLHTRHNKIFLAMLRGLRESKHLRQSDLASLLGRSQATVSNVERGERRLDLIELRDWLDALEVDFIGFLSALEAELRRLGMTPVQHRAQKRGPSQEPTAMLREALLAAAVTGK
jgi:transcriptional regulator with XRE-family HTH domain